VDGPIALALDLLWGFTVLAIALGVRHAGAPATNDQRERSKEPGSRPTGRTAAASEIVVALERSGDGTVRARGTVPLAKNRPTDLAALRAPS
jgi:hypothetical protein